MTGPTIPKTALSCGKLRFRLDVQAGSDYSLACMTARLIRGLVASACVTAVVVAVPVALAATRGSSGATAPQKASEPGDVATGKKVYIQFCGKCHTLAAVGAKGTLGPNLDQDKVSYTRVVTAIEEGVGGIQAEYVLRHVSFTEVYDVAKFVVAARQAGGTSGENS